MGNKVNYDAPNEITRSAMQSAEDSEDLYGPFDSVSELMEALDASDTAARNSNA